MTEQQKTDLLSALTAGSLDTAGVRPCVEYLNNTQTTGSVVKEGQELIPKAEILAMLADDEVVNLLSFFGSGTNQAVAFQYRWDSLENLDVAHAVTRASVQALADGGIVGADKVAYLLSLGERPAVIADDILGRLATTDDVTEARNG